jgi:hypothetical protein
MTDEQKQEVMRRHYEGMQALSKVTRKPRICKVGPDQWNCNALVDGSGYFWSKPAIITGTGKTPTASYARWWTNACVHRGEYETPWGSLFPLQSPQVVNQ